MAFEPTPIKYYKFQVGGKTQYEALPFLGNTPFGHTEVGEQEFRQSTGSTQQFTSPYTFAGGTTPIDIKSLEQSIAAGQGDPRSSEYAANIKKQFTAQGLPPLQGVQQPTTFQAAIQPQQQQGVVPDERAPQGWGIDLATGRFAPLPGIQKTTSQPLTQQTVSQDRLLGPTEYSALVKQLGVGPANFDQYFSRKGGDIYLKGTQPSTQPRGFEGMQTYSNMPIGIQLRSGLSQQQKESIINLFSNKPREQWTAEDKRSYEFATNVENDPNPETIWTKQNFPIIPGKITPLSQQDTSALTQQPNFKAAIDQFQAQTLQQPSIGTIGGIDIGSLESQLGLPGLREQEATIQKKLEDETRNLTTRFDALKTELSTRGLDKIADQIATYQKEALTQQEALRKLPEQKAAETAPFKVTAGQLERLTAIDRAKITQGLLNLQQLSNIEEQRYQRQYELANMAAQAGVEGAQNALKAIEIQYNATVKQREQSEKKLMDFVGLIEKDLDRKNPQQNLQLTFDGAGNPWFFDSKTGAFGQVSPGQIQGQPTGAISTGSTRAERNNNPGNIKYGNWTKQWVEAGLATIDPNPAADGGNFLIFKSPEIAKEAAITLLTQNYSNLTVDAALKKWSNNGYGANIVPTSIPANKKIGELTGAQLDTVYQAMATAEGFRIALTGAPAQTGFVPKGAIDLNRALTPEEQIQYGKPAGTKLGEVQGQQPLTPGQRESTQTFTAAKQIVSKLSEEFFKLPVAETAFGRLTKGLSLKAGAALQTNPQATAYNSFRKSTLSLLVRALGEKGTLTDRDIARIEANIPKLTDTKIVAKSKIGNLQDLINRIQQENIKSFSTPPGQKSPLNSIFKGGGLPRKPFA